MSKTVPINIRPEMNALWEMGEVRIISISHSLCGFPCISTQIPALRCTKVSILSKSPGFTRISWQAFSTRCCNTSVSVQYTKIFRCSNSKMSWGLSSGEPARQFTGPPPFFNCSPKVLFRCCLRARRKWGGASPRMNHASCPWWRSSCSKTSSKSFTKKTWYTALVIL
jgi:hypothetical protein